MKFYTQQHKHYCGIDLHARAMYVCILDQSGTKLVHRNLPTTPEALLRLLTPYREDVVVGVECMFTWYWLADFCQKEGIAFVLGHALYMKAIHGGKAKNDKIDAHKIAVLLRGGMFPQAYVYPVEMRATRDLLRRRCHLVRKRAELLAHIHNTNSQYNLPASGKRLAYKANRDGVADHFPDPSVRKTIEVDVSLIDHYDKLLGEVELYLTRTTKGHDGQTFSRLQSVPGIGQILALVILYEIQDITRFPRVQDFVSYCRLVKCVKESGGKWLGTSGKADPLISVLIEELVADRPVGRLILSPIGVELAGDLRGQLISNAFHRSPRMPRYASRHFPAFLCPPNYTLTASA